MKISLSENIRLLRKQRKLTQEKLQIVREKAELRAKTRQPIQYIIRKLFQIRTV